MEGIITNLIKAIYENPTANILNGERLNTFSYDQEQNIYLHHFYSTQYLNNNPMKINKMHPNWKESIKTVCRCLEHLKIPQKLSSLFFKFKSNQQHCYTLTRNNREKFHLSEHQKKKKNLLGINLGHEAEDLHTENCKRPVNEINEDINKWKDITYSQIGRFNVVEMTTLPKTIYIPNTILIRIMVTLFCKNKKALIKIHVESQEALKNQNNLENEEPHGSIHT